ncbi:hypothetical protein BHE74_00005882 [Ensete ventricosum]|nr:hypothetical protein BHE74_00005882 [Ensete ventricosum]
MWGERGGEEISLRSLGRKSASDGSGLGEQHCISRFSLLFFYLFFFLPRLILTEIGRRQLKSTVNCLTTAGNGRN